MNIELIPSIAGVDLFCHQCLDLGIPHKTIIAEQDCLVISIGGDWKAFCCMDCYRRLFEEMQSTIDSGFDLEE